MVQSERNSHSKNQGWIKPKLTIVTYTERTYRNPSEQLFSQKQNFPKACLFEMVYYKTLKHIETAIWLSCICSIIKVMKT